LNQIAPQVSAVNIEEQIPMFDVWDAINDAMNGHVLTRKNLLPLNAFLNNLLRTRPAAPPEVMDLDTP
jgi:hypothetical protein